MPETISIDEAIKLLQEDIDNPGSVAIEDVNKAEALGIEALKRELLFRERVPKKDWSLLPGETKN